MTSILRTSVNNSIYALHNPAGMHVGNLKWIQGQWKFKAVGYEPSGLVIPGGGPLTDRHNATFDQLDEALIRATFFDKE
jgi:hypothetical protein